MNKTQAKKIASIAVNVFLWVFLAFAALVTILTFVSVNAKDGVPSLFGKSFVSVQTPSMDGDKEGSFKQGDILIVDKISENEAYSLEIGTIVVYRAPEDIDGDGKTGDINTHRIIAKSVTEGGIVHYKTQGDANSHPDDYTKQGLPDGIRHSDVIAVYNGHSRLKGIGSVADFLRTSIGFLLVVVLPMALFFIYEVYNLIKILMEQKLKKAAATVSAETEEEIKRRAIEEFLAQQAAAAAAPIATESQPASEENSTENDQPQN